jgi:Fur family ferric uptake transcriptional regulator
MRIILVEVGVAVSVHKRRTSAADATAASDRRLTRQQRAIRDATQRLTSFASSQRVHEDLLRAGVHVGLSTVYRTLPRLAERGEIDSVVSRTGEVWYRGCASDAEASHHHLVCHVCGRGVDLESPEVNAWIESVAVQNHFRAVDRTVQLSGVCGDCSAMRNRAEAPGVGA